MTKQGRWLLALLLIVSQTQAQSDELDDSFAPPPPPNFDNFNPSSPPPPAFPSGGSNGGGMNSGDVNSLTSEGGALTPAQKQKFSQAPIEDINNENFPETIDSFDFPNADIQDIVKAVSELTGKNFIIDPGVRGKITIIAPTKITVAEAYKAFLSALAINGYAVVPSGSFLKIRTARNAQRDGIETYSGNYFPNADQMVTKIIHLKHISSEAVNRDLRILQSKDGEMSPYPPTNSLIISDYGSNIERITRILNQLDVPGFEDQLEVIQVRYAKAKDMAELIMRIVNRGEQQQQRGGAFTAGVPRFGRANATQGNQGSAYFVVIPDERTNSLIVTGNKAGLERINRLLKQLDRRVDAGETGGIYVYNVKYGDAEKIAQTLSGIAKEAAPRPAAGNASQAPNISPVSGIQNATQEIFGGDVRITADKTTNSLVIIASKQDYEIILNLLRKLDIQRDQVFVEAIIMEMSGNQLDDYKIGFMQFVGENGMKAGFNGINGTDLNSLLSPTGGTGVILPFGDPNNVVKITPVAGGTAMTIPSLLGFINFLKQNQNGNVLSSPGILALDAQEASIVVGDKVVTGSSAVAGVAGAAPVVTPTFEDANLELKVKPFISPEDQYIRMDFEASLKQLSNVRTPTAFQSTAQPLSTRKVKTNIMVRSGDTAVLGGLTKEEEQESITKIPLLGDIPVLGWLFKSRNLSRGKVNLNIFLTPRIIRTDDDAKNLLTRKLDQRLDYIKATGGRDPFGSTMDEIQKAKTENGIKSQ